VTAISLQRSDRVGAGVLGSGFAVWWRELPRLAAVAAPIWVPYQVVQAVLFVGLGVAGNAAAIDAAGNRITSGGTVDAASLLGPAAALAVYGVLSLVLAVVALSLAQGALSRVAASATRGERCEIGEALASGWRRLPSVLATNLLLGAVILVVEIVVALAAAVLAFALGLLGLAPAATGIGALALIVAPLAVFARLATAPQAAALDGIGAAPALRQARLELRGRFWVSLLVVVVTGAVAWTVAIVLQAAAGAVAGGPAAAVAGTIGGTLAAVFVGPLPQAALTALHVRSLERDSAASGSDLVHPPGEATRAKPIR
jgi:hypothetical protein